MKSVFCLVLSLVLFCNNVLADTVPSSPTPSCDWTQIKQLPDGGYEYSPALNLCVGNLVQANKIQTQQIQDYTAAIQLKDLAIKDSDSRATLWINTADSAQQKLMSIESDSKKNEFLYFGLGLLTAIGTGFAVSRLVH